MLLLAVPAGVLGTWIVLRRLAFFTHAVGTASFPGLVLASAWGIAPQLAAVATALGFGVAQERLERTRRVAPDAATGLLLVACSRSASCSPPTCSSRARRSTRSCSARCSRSRTRTCG